MSLILTACSSALASEKNATIFNKSMTNTCEEISLLKDIDFLNIILPSPPDNTQAVTTELDEVSSSDCIVKELLKFQEVVASTATKGTNTEDLSTCSEMPQQGKQSKNDDEVICVSNDYTNCKSPKGFSEKKKSVKEHKSRNNLNNKRRNKRDLTFPPCVICNGKATGSHYGAITCEACKGFFRRHLQKKTYFKCNKGGNCEIVSSKKGGPCSGCRLKKCLDIGMAKERSKIGRYTLTKRTEVIIRMNKLDKKSETDKVVMPAEIELDIHVNRNPTRFDDKLVGKLVQSMDELEMYGSNIKTKEQVQECHKHISESFHRKVELFGKMGSIPKDEFDKLYKEFGIDIDGRIANMKIEFQEFETYAFLYENFANQIPGFTELHEDDQTNLLKVAMIDFSVVIANDAYNSEYNTFVSTNGYGYHFEEFVDKIYSRELISIFADMYCRWQGLCLNREETAILGALTLVSADRCKLQNRTLVENMQLSLMQLLQVYTKKVGQPNYLRRFVKIIDALTKTRELSALFMKEHNEISNDEVLLKEVPYIAHLFVEDTY